MAGFESVTDARPVFVVLASLGDCGGPRISPFRDGGNGAVRLRDLIPIDFSCILSLNVRYRFLFLPVVEKCFAWDEAFFCGLALLDIDFISPDFRHLPLFFPLNGKWSFSHMGNLASRSSDLDLRVFPGIVCIHIFSVSGTLSLGYARLS